MENGEATLNDIDLIMSLEPPLSSADIDTVIEWHRKQRARRASGDRAVNPKVDLSSIMKMTAPAPSVVIVERRD